MNRKNDAKNADRRAASYSTGYKLQALDLRAPLIEGREESFALGAWDCRHGIPANPESVRGRDIV